MVGCDTLGQTERIASTPRSVRSRTGKKRRRERRVKEMEKEGKTG